MTLGFDRDHLYERRLREQQPVQTHFQGQDAIKRLNDAIKPVQEQPHQNPKTYCMDFDGVLHQHETGSGSGPLGDPLSPGIRMAKRIKATGHKLVILTARPPDQHHTIDGWLKGHGVRADEVTNVKPPAEMYIDDRAEHWPRNAGAESEPPPSGQGPSISIARKASSEGGPGSGPKKISWDTKKSPRGKLTVLKTIPLSKLSGVSAPDHPRVVEYSKAMKRGDKFPAIEVAPSGDGKWTTVDGYHRAAAAKKLGAIEIPVWTWKRKMNESRIDHFGENSGDGSMNMLDGHRYKSLGSH